jgi:DNA-binding response OmpR family regulator
VKRILIADDEPYVLRVIKLRLERAGYQVECASNGQLALERLRVDPPDVLITDIQMPVMSGKDLCARIQAELPQRKFLIFVITSRTEVEHRVWSSRLHNMQFLEKPVSMGNLLAKLDEYFSRPVATAES